MEVGKQRNQWWNAILWLLVNTFSWPLYILIGMAAGWLVWEAYEVLTDQMFIPFLDDESNRMLLTFILLGVGWGAVIGFLQQIVLKQRFNLDRQSWISASCIGMTLYLVFGQLESIIYDFRIFQPFGYGLHIFAVFVSSTLLGTAQWVILRHSCKLAGLWILATVLALGVSPMVVNLLNFGRGWGHGRNYLLYSVFLSLITGFVYGLVTWIFLALISRQSGKPLENQPGFAS